MTIADRVYEKLKAAPAAVAQEVLDFLEFIEARRRPGKFGPPKSFDGFFGALKGSKAIAGDPVEIQRKLRDEWR